MLRPTLLTAFALFAASSSGCLFSGRPCEPGNWHYHSCGCWQMANYGDCRTCETTPAVEDLGDDNLHGGLKPTLWTRTPRALDGSDDTQGRPDRPTIQPTPGKIPPLPSPSTGQTGQSRPSRRSPPQVWLNRSGRSPIGPMRQPEQAHSPVRPRMRLHAASKRLAGNRLTTRLHEPHQQRPHRYRDARPWKSISAAPLVRRTRHRQRLRRRAMP